MSTEPVVIGEVPVAVGTPLTMKELAGLLVRHYGLHEGKFDLLIEYQFGVGAVGPNKESINPGVMIGISKVGLAATTRPNVLSVDAAEANPRGKASTLPVLAVEGGARSKPKKK